MQRNEERGYSSVGATIVRTATDALQAKYSAIVLAGYPILPNSDKSAENGDDNNHEIRSESPNRDPIGEALYHV
jgi:hypothetical protein